MITLSKLNYAYDALEPVIDAKTMEIHHTKHHQVYIDKLNSVLERHADLASMDVAEMMQKLPTLVLDSADKKMFQNFGGGHINHELFWTLMDPANAPDDVLAQEIATTFGSVEEFKKQFNDAAVKQFGSGWAWLVRNTEGKLQVYSLPNQDSPLLQGHTPIITLDVWEHAYYLKYQNRRLEYIENWWKVVKII